ncbi:MAG: class I SAM-dependent methyltransferase [Nitrososphaerales archaeon]|jgi:SAM-dependent methyltransferase
MSRSTPSVETEASGRATPPFAARGEAGYGIDEPRSIIELLIAGALSITIGLDVAVYTRTDPSLARVGLLGLVVGPAVGLLILAVAAALYRSSQKGKVAEMSKLIADIPWGGDEVVLDIGCGRGLGMVLASKRLEGGYSVGVDLWQKSHLTGNDPSSIWANAAQEGVQERVAPVKADTGSLPLTDSSVDVILSALSLHRLIQKKDRVLAFKEVARVLKQGGRVGIIDTGYGGEYSKAFREVGLSDISVRRIRFSGFPPFQVILARKPFRG